MLVPVANAGSGDHFLRRLAGSFTYAAEIGPARRARAPAVTPNAPRMERSGGRVTLLHTLWWEGPPPYQGEFLSYHVADAHAVWTVPVTVRSSVGWVAAMRFDHAVGRAAADQVDALEAVKRVNAIRADATWLQGHLIDPLSPDRLLVQEDVNPAILRRHGVVWTATLQHDRATELQFDAFSLLDAGPVSPIDALYAPSAAHRDAFLHARLLTEATPILESAQLRSGTRVAGRVQLPVAADLGLIVQPVPTGLAETPPLSRWSRTASSGSRATGSRFPHPHRLLAGVI
jgi:hypothetical protein